MIDFCQIDEILASYEYYRLANRFKRITSVSQDEIDKEGYDIQFISKHGYTHEKVLKDTLQFVYMLLTDFYVEVVLIKNGINFEIDFNTNTDDRQQIDLFNLESIANYLKKKRYVAIGKIEFKKYNSEHPSACSKFKNKPNSSLEMLSPKIIDFLATYPIIFYLNENEHGKKIENCKQIDEMANKHFSRHILPRLKDTTVISKLLSHCQKVLKKDKVIISVDVSLGDNSSKEVRFHRQLAEDIYYSIIYELIDQMQQYYQGDIVENLENKIKNDKSGHRRIEKFFFSTQNRKITEYLKKIDARKEGLKCLHLDIASTLKFFS